jgi:hypothetical protein
MIDFEIWLKIWQFHLTVTPGNFTLTRIKNGLFYYLIDWHKTEPKPKKKTVTDDDFDPIPF